MVALLRALRRIYAGGAIIQNSNELIHVGTVEAIELLEAAAGRPAVERPGGTLFPRRSLVALAEVAGVVSVELEDLGNVCTGVGNHPGRARPRRGEFRDHPHVH